jgi:hypothetical protein
MQQDTEFYQQNGRRMNLQRPACSSASVSKLWRSSLAMHLALTENYCARGLKGAALIELAARSQRFAPPVRLVCLRRSGRIYRR